MHNRSDKTDRYNATDKVKKMELGRPLGLKNRQQMNKKIGRIQEILGDHKKDRFL